MFRVIALFLLLSSCFVGSLSQSEVCGGEVDIAEHPYHASFLIQGNYFCTATLISDRHAILAVHCLNRLPDRVISLRAGSSHTSSGGVERVIESYWAHNQWQQYDYAVGMVKVIEPFELSPSIQPVKLPAFGELINVGDITTVTFFNGLESGADSTLVKMSIPILDSEICLLEYQQTIWRESMYCGGRVDGGAETCVFNRGSPMILDGTLVGVAVLNWGQVRPDYPSGYTKIGLVRDWINSTTGV